MPIYKGGINTGNSVLIRMWAVLTLTESPPQISGKIKFGIGDEPESTHTKYLELEVCYAADFSAITLMSLTNDKAVIGSFGKGDDDKELLEIFGSSEVFFELLKPMTRGMATMWSQLQKNVILRKRDFSLVTAPGKMNEDCVSAVRKLASISA